MGSGRHSSDEEFEFDFSQIKYVVIIIIILLIIAGIIFGTFKLVNKMQEMKTQTVSTEEVIPESKYKILGKIKIDKIGVEQDILDTKDNEALEKGVIKIYGDKLNGLGNFCIAGHNYENIFKKLDEMELGDELEIVDKAGKSTFYKVNQIESTEPTDLELLKSEEEKIQITLITCENYSTKRLIVKAEKIEK